MQELQQERAALEEPIRQAQLSLARFQRKVIEVSYNKLHLKDPFIN
jgi:hypothetical protein